MISKTRKYLGPLMLMDGYFRRYAKSLKAFISDLYIEDEKFTYLLKEYIAKDKELLFIQINLPSIDSTELRSAIVSMSNNKNVIFHYFDTTSILDFNKFFLVVDITPYRDKKELFLKGLYNQMYSDRELHKIGIKPMVDNIPSILYRVLTFRGKDNVRKGKGYTYNDTTMSSSIPINDISSIFETSYSDSSARKSKVVTTAQKLDIMVAKYNFTSTFGDLNIDDDYYMNVDQLDVPPIIKNETKNYGYIKERTSRQKGRTEEDVQVQETKDT